jgi:RNA polymerase sigma factor (TIGR02999 family)
MYLTRPTDARIIQGLTTVGLPGKLAAMSDVTRLLRAIEHGDPSAAEQLLPLVYDELRRLAAQRLAQEAPGQTLQATALVHEAYLRLVGDLASFTNRRHFLAAATEAMRRILIDNARRKAAQIHGGGRARVEVDADHLPAAQPPDELLALDEALVKFAQVDATAAELVKLRYFAGLSLADAAAALGLAPRSADRLWAYARAWLRAALADE